MVMCENPMINDILMYISESKQAEEDQILHSINQFQSINIQSTNKQLRKHTKQRTDDDDDDDDDEDYYGTTTTT